MGLAGCGGSGSGGSTAADSKAQALQMLSSAHKANFDAWKSSLLKSCDASEAFGLERSGRADQTGVDGIALLQKNDNSVIFSNENILAILSQYRSLSGVATTQVNQTEEENGSSYSIAAKTERSGSSCVLYLYGQKVYETVLAESFTVGTQYMTGKDITGSSQNLKITNIGNSGFSEVSQSGIFETLYQSFKPKSSVLGVISAKLGISNEQVNQFFKLDAQSPNLSIRIANDSSAIWTSNFDATITAKSSTIAGYFATSASSSLPLEIRLSVPKFDFKDVRNTSDQGSLKLEALLQITRKDPKTIAYTLLKMKNHGMVASNQPSGSKCLHDRFSAYFSNTSNRSVIQPSVDFVFSPCRVLHREIDGDYSDYGFLKNAMSQVFAGVQPSPQTQYGGWDKVLVQFAKKFHEDGRNLLQELDPVYRSKTISALSTNMEILKSALQSVPKQGEAEGYLFDMIFNWSFKGYSISQSKLDLIVKAVNNSYATFKTSTRWMLDALIQNPNTPDEQIARAASFDATYKAEATKAYELARELNYSEFEANTFNYIIQRPVSFAELKELNARLLTIRDDLGKYPNLNSYKSELLTLSTKWLKTKEVSAQELANVYSAISNVGDTFTESTKQLLRDLNTSYSAHKYTVDFAKDMSAEYKKLALSIKESSKAAGFEEKGQNLLKSVLQQKTTITEMRAWNALWTSTVAFVARERAKAPDEEFGSRAKDNRRRVVDIAITEMWSDEEYTALETISLLGKLKSMCDRYKDASSLADCSGLRPFSKKSKMLFDPEFAGRYKALGADFNVYVSQITDFKDTFLRRSFADTLLDNSNPIWSKCDNSVFAQKSKDLKAAVASFVGDPNTMKRWEAERKIKDIMENCR